MVASHSTFPVRDLDKGTVTSQAGFLNVKEVNILCNFHVNNVLCMLNISSFICSILYKGLYDNSPCLPVTSQPGLARGSSIQGQRRDT